MQNRKGILWPKPMIILETILKFKKENMNYKQQGLSGTNTEKAMNINSKNQNRNLVNGETDQALGWNNSMYKHFPYLFVRLT